MTASGSDALSLFHPFVQDWFAEQIGKPTDVQRLAWRPIAQRENVLVSAPTGSGKTLTAFLWAINQLITGELETGHTRVLYVSPLKALNNDIRRNLSRPLRELEEYFIAADEPFPEIRVLTRSGDTPTSDRRRMTRTPPEILITTPESLNLLLSSGSGRSILTGIETLILDEIHAVVGSKRGAHLMTAVERLARISGEFQRIALSATVKPMETVAEFVGGYELSGDPLNPTYAPRPVATVRSTAEKRYDIGVRFPKESAEEQTNETFWEPLVEEFREIIRRNRSTLLFTNSRRLCERITLFLNAVEESPIAYSHHGSLSREIREEVERKLKAGELKAIVATSSLEMGIDVGALDEVVLIQAPKSISSAIQRIGRAGHQVGETSRATLFPTHPRDFIDAATLASSILDHDIEEVRPIRCPLDVLAQVVVSMTAMETWDIDDLYAFIRTSYPYRALEREPFDAVLNMLAGRYADTRVRELKPRVSIDRLDNTVSARSGALQVLYMSGGTIPDRGYFHLRHHETNARIGELDEEYVWERDEGTTFTLGAQGWKIERITHNDVFASPVRGKAEDMPFWKAEKVNRDFHFSGKIARFLEDANDRLMDDAFFAELQERHGMDETAASALLGFLRSQKEATRKDLPHRHHLLIERVESGSKGAPVEQVVMHTLWGSQVNRPYALALDAAFEDRFDQRIETFAENDCVILLAPFEIDGEELLSLVTSSMLEPLLRKRLEGSGFFGARFRECAGRALLVTRHRMGQRMPLWLSRLRAKKLLESVLPYEDFPILLETWRTCLQDEFDMDSTRQILTELESGAIRWSETRTAFASPFAQTVAWRQINDNYMYAGDEPSGGKTSNLRGDLLKQVVFTPGLRPTVPRDIIERFEAKLQRTAPGYAPTETRDLVDWVKERVAVPASEWNRLLNRVRVDADVDPVVFVTDAADKLVRVYPRNGEPLIIALERARPILAAFFTGESLDVLPIVDGLPPPSLPDGDDEDEDAEEILTTLLGDWLQFHGPVREAFVRGALGIERRRLSAALQDLIDSEKLIHGELVAGDEEETLCDAQNFESLLRLTRADAAPSFEPLEIEWLPLFLAEIQGLTKSRSDEDAVFETIERLFAMPARAELWESEIFPARVQPYMTAWLDAIMQEGHLRWVGFGGRQVAFSYDADMDLIWDDESLADEEDEPNDGLAELFPDAEGRYDFGALQRSSGKASASLIEILWNAAWSGRVTNDSFVSLRRGIATRFAAPDAMTTARRAPSRRRYGGGDRGLPIRTRGAAHFAGSWMRLSKPDVADGLIESEERKKERVRILLDRYGVLFRELLQRELPAFRWGSLFRTLRLMELSGELLAGAFFHGIPGPQFVSHQAFRMLQRQLQDDAIYWINALDPASLCGLQLDALRGELPRREASVHLVYHGPRLALTSRRNGKDLTINVPPDDPHLPQYLAPLRHLLTRAAQPLPRIVVETINEEDAGRSDYADAFREPFDAAVDYKTITLFRKIA